MTVKIFQIEKSKELFKKYFSDNGEIIHFFSPGRVNIIGEHLDYNGGYVFPAALSIGIHGLVRFNDSTIIRMRSEGFEDEYIINLAETIENDNTGGWGNYPAGVIKYMIDQDYSIQGADILFSSTLPDGAGLSSSACIEVLMGYILRYKEINNADARIDLAVLCKDVENNFIGVQCGIMDQFAIAMGKKDHAILLNSDTLGYQHAPIDLTSHRLLIMNTNKQRKLADSKYNERRSECTKALNIIQNIRSIENLTEASIEEVENIEDEILKKRARHVVSENNRVLESVELLKENNIIRFGKLLTESHISLQNDYEVTGFELDSLVHESLAADGCIGARMTGAGFGGCAIALVALDKVESFKDMVGSAYKEKTGLTADFYETEIEDGVKNMT